VASEPDAESHNAPPQPAFESPKSLSHKDQRCALLLGNRTIMTRALRPRESALTLMTTSADAIKAGADISALQRGIGCDESASNRLVRWTLEPFIAWPRSRNALR
jgi:hypothetical protein